VIHVKNKDDYAVYMLMKVIIKNVIIALACLALSLVLTFAVEKYELIFLKKYILILFLVLFFATSVYINKGMFKNIKINYIRYLLIIIICSLITAVIGFLAFVILVNFDLAIGGRL
jgi:hypothetical protein